MRMSIAEVKAMRIRERNQDIQTGPYWALVDTSVREVIYAFDLNVQAREMLKRYSDDGCTTCVLKRCETLGDVIGWHEPFTGEDEIERREQGQNKAEYEWETA